MIIIEEPHSNSDSTPELKARAEALERTLAPTRDSDECIETSEPRGMTPQLETWKKIFKTRRLLKGERPGIAAEEAEKDALTCSIELEQEVKRLADLETKPERETAALQKVLEICENRIADNEGLIEFIETSSQDEADAEIKRRFFSKSSISAERCGSLIPGLMAGARNDIEFYQIIKKLLSMCVSHEYLIEYLYSGIYIRSEEQKQLTVAEGNKVDNTNPEFEFYHYRALLKILKPFLSPAYEEFHKVHVNHDTFRGIKLNERFTFNLDYAKSCSEVLSRFESRLEFERSLSAPENSSFKEQAQELRQAIETISRETKAVVERLKPSNEEADRQASSSQASKAPPAKTKRVSDFQAEKKQKMDAKQNDTETQNGENLEMFDITVTLKKGFFLLWSIKQSVAELEEELSLVMESVRFEAALQTKYERSITAVPGLLSAGGEAEKKMSTSSSSALDSTSKPEEGTTEGASPPRKSSEEEKLKQERLAHKRALQEKVEAHREKMAQKRAEAKEQLQSRIRMIRKRGLDQIDVKEEVETTLQAFEVDQLMYLDDLMSKDHFLTLENLSNKREETLFDPNLKALVGVVKGRTEFLGSSHFEILVPNTRRPWPINPKTGVYDVETIPLVRRVSWLHRIEGGHSRPLLKPRAKSRCEAVMQTGGLTPARFEAAKATVENQRRRGYR